jgi:hypothetical protein
MERTKMKEQTFSRIVMSAIVITLLIAAITYSYNSFFNEDYKSHQNIVFNVTGIINATNSSIISIQYECIQFCGSDNLNYQSASLISTCWKECAKLGENEK